jgi:5-methylcytosine-specific restriction protein A
VSRRVPPRWRPCALCDAPARGSLCRSCHRGGKAAAGRRPGLSNDWGERQRRAAFVAEHRRTVGDICPGYGVPEHHATDLTADHVVPVAAGGSEDGPLAILCRSCNGRKSDRAGPIAPARSRQQTAICRCYALACTCAGGN